MKPDYKNWMPKGMIYSFLGGSIGCGVAAIKVLPMSRTIEYCTVENSGKRW